MDILDILTIWHPFGVQDVTLPIPTGYCQSLFAASNYTPDLTTGTGEAVTLFASSTHTPSMIGVTSGGTSALFVGQNYTAGVAVGGVQDT